MKFKGTFLIKVVAMALVFAMCMSTITVEAATANMWLKNYYLTVNVGKTGNIAIKANTTGKKVTYSSSNKKVATVSSKGVVTGVKAGKATITVKAGNVTRKCIVTVKSNWVSVKSLSFDCEFYPIDIGQTYYNEISIYPSNASNQTIKYSSSDPSIAKIDSKGNVTGLKQGEVIITAKASNGVTQTYELDVSGDEYMEIEREEKPPVYDSSLVVKQGKIELGMSIKNLQSVVGEPDMVLDSEFGCPAYIYNSDYESLVFVYVKGGKVVGYYTNAKEFASCGVKSGLTKEQVKEITTNVGGVNTDEYNIFTWYGEGDRLTSVQVLVGTMKYYDTVRGYLEKANWKIRSNIEKMCFEILNGYRAVNGVSLVSCDEMASSVARNHSIEMKENQYLDHISLDGLYPWERLKMAGISYTHAGEIQSHNSNMSAGDNMDSFMSSEKHREIMLSPNFTTVGIGMTLGDGWTDKMGTINIVLYD